MADLGRGVLLQLGATGIAAYGLLVVVTPFNAGYVCASIPSKVVLSRNDFASADRWLDNDHSLTQS